MAHYYPRAIAVLQVVFQHGDPTRPEVIQVPIRRGTFSLNSYRIPDTFSLEFSSRLLPLDPDLVRAIAVEAYLWDAGENSQEVERFLSALDANGDPLHLQVAGLVNRHQIRVSADGSISLEGDDYTALLAAADWPEGQTIPVGGNLQETTVLLVQEALGQGAAGATLRVRWEKDDLAKDPPVVGQGMGPQFRRGIPVPSGWNYWDAIHNLAAMHGAIASVQGTTVVLAAPRALTRDTLKRARRLIYGRNLQEFSSARDLGHRPAPQVVATSYDPKARKVITASWPATARASSRHATGHGKAEAVRVEAPRGIVDQGALQAFARSYHAQIARAEAEITFSTRHLRDADGKDLISLRAGDPVWVEWDAFRREEIGDLDQGAQFRRLVALGYGEDVAGVIVRNMDALAGFNRPYYLREAVKEWDQGRGISLSGTAVNYVDPSASGEDAAPPPPQTPQEVIAASQAPIEAAFQSPAFQDLLRRPAVE